MRKRVFAWIGVILVATMLIGGVISSVASYATYYGEHPERVADLVELEAYAGAIAECLNSGAMKKYIVSDNGANVNLGRKGGDWRGAFKSALNLYANNIFGYDGVNMQDSLLDLKTTVGTQTNGNFDCNDLELFHLFLQKLHGGLDVSDFKKLVCDRNDPSKPGILKITQRYFQDRSEVVDSDCGKNWDLLWQYLWSDTLTGYDIFVELEPADNRLGYFKDYVLEFLGRSPNHVEQKYIENYVYYDTLCSPINNGKTELVDDKTEYNIPIFDVGTGKIFYHSEKSENPNKRIYKTPANYYQSVGVSGPGTITVQRSNFTCKEILTSLKIDSRSDESIKALYLRTNAAKAAINDCIKKYADTRNDYQKWFVDYTNARSGATRIKDQVSRLLSIIDNRQGNINDRAPEATGNERGYFKDALSNSLAILENGVDDGNGGRKVIFEGNTFKLLVDIAKDLVDSELFNDIGDFVSGAEVDQAQIDDMHGVLEDATGIVDEMNKNATDIAKILHEYPIASEPIVKEDYLNVWQYKREEDKAPVIECPGDQNLIDSMNSMDVVPKKESEYDPDKYKVTTEDLTTTSPPENNQDLCMMNGDSLGWWLCPVIKKIGATLDTVYEEAVEPFLQVNPDLLTQNATRDVWTTVVGIANIAVVIFFLVIIFSQLTGVGLDNYNIKKMLPKIIVVVVLVNLSYLICQLAVDVSNIVGNGLDDMLRNAAPASVNLRIKLQDDELVNMKDFTQSTNTAWFKALVDAATFGIAIGGVVKFAGAVSGGTIISGFVLPILLMLIVVLFAVIFFFLLMGIRQAGVVMLVILAPLAMVCYMLPNTKKYFDKWKKAFGSLLLLYPICGLIVGGGELASRLLIQVSDGSYLIIVVALALLVVPFFFIPTLLKGSLQAMGNIGAKVSGLGSKMGKGASSRVRNSDAYKRSQERAMEKKAIWRGGLKRNADGSYSAKKVGKFGRMMRGGKRAMADSRTQAIAAREKRQRTESMMGVGFDAAAVAQDKKFESEELANWMTLVNNETRNGEDEDALFALYQKFLESDNKSGAVAVARIAGRRKDTAQRFMGEKFNDLSKYSPKLAQSIAKEISTGENNRMYMESAPLQFEYAAQLNRARDLRYNKDTEQFEHTVTYRDEDGNEHVRTESMAAQFKTTREVEGPGGVKRTEIVGGWANNQQNIHSAIDKYITDRSQLAGMKGSSLDELVQLMDAKDADGNYVMKPEDQAHLRKLAAEHIENGLKGLEKIDYTKAQRYADLSGGAYTYDPKTREFTKNTTSTPAPAPNPERSEGGAKPTAGSQDPTRIDLDHSRDRVYNNEDQGGEISEL